MEIDSNDHAKRPKTKFLMIRHSGGHATLRHLDSKQAPRTNQRSQ